MRYSTPIVREQPLFIAKLKKVIQYFSRTDIAVKSDYLLFKNMSYTSRFDGDDQVRAALVLFIRNTLSSLGYSPATINQFIAADLRIVIQDALSRKNKTETKDARDRKMQFTLLLYVAAGGSLLLFIDGLIHQNGFSIVFSFACAGFAFWGFEKKRRTAASQRQFAECLDAADSVLDMAQAIKVYFSQL